MELLILLVEDEKKLRDILAQQIRQEGWKVVPAANGLEAIQFWQDIKPDLVVLDLMLPGISGWEVLKKIRQKDNTPIIVLTARADEVDKLLGLELGADDYMTKPFSPRELCARIKAVLRRGRYAEQVTSVTFNNLTIYPEKLEASIADVKLNLTSTEYKILMLLAENPGQVFSRLHILERVFGDMYEGYERTIDTHISNLRHKIDATQKSEIIIKTVYGIGYKLVAGE
ncbi:Signal transduction response regulator, receiver domain [Syntrophomonas zehnderi OL-4]|uniref:Stage 0 sporulation protein A homolog n=1 Tax=Syntrophomonas zehnderi OL-4 TaxID=690567 RepID=A0A0E4G9U9_9FIRM|nr:response regulator transcription factor [Syntrophomonas zehnderi]CFW96893.1 Signal transduction response regulator, receiver domain [Syntrophomonas zehnderi OL-4]